LILSIMTPWEGTSAAYSVSILPRPACFQRSRDLVCACDGVASVGQRFGPDFDGAFLRDAQRSRKASAETADGKGREKSLDMY
jgi:hypothetical protein